MGVSEVVTHLNETRVWGDDQLEEGDVITSSVVILKVERLDEDEPEFCVMHTGDYITASGLIALAKNMLMKNIAGSEDE